jgi:hypothetical protein
MSGQWPPEWEDQEEESSATADQLDTEAEARLSEVAAYLASVPVPVLPDAVETRINAALAAEAAGSRALGPAPGRARVRRHSLSRHSVRRHSGGGRSRRDFLRRPVVAVGSLVVCLLLAGLGFTLSLGSTPQTESNSAASGTAGSSFAAGSSSAGSRAAGIAPAASAAESGPEYAGAASSFLVTASGTRYQRASLSEQVRTRLTAKGAAGSPGASVPAEGASSTSTGAGPTAALRGCVLHLTGDVPPRLVDRATYQGEPAYVIASSTRVWVVGLGCTAAKTELIVSVALAGLPGNLRALVSVEH